MLLLSYVSRKYSKYKQLKQPYFYRCKEQFVFTPFGHGARQCPGRRVAQQEIEILFREILTNFQVDYHHQPITTKVRLFNKASCPPRFKFTELK